MNKGKRVADFFIVGAPKCGTTSLAAWLRQHPQIYMPLGETNFLSTDLEMRRTVESWEEYYGLFVNVPEYILIGEKSVSYLYSEVAAKTILSFGRHTKVIILLRNPVDMLWSIHGQLCRNGDETEFDFRKAWQLESERRKGRKIPKNSPAVCFLFYRMMGSYFRHVKRYLDLFGPNRAKIIIFEGLISKPKEAYRDILDFLEVNSEFMPPQFSAKNRYLRVKNQKLHILLTSILRRPPQPVLKLAKSAIPKTVRGKVKSLIRLNLAESPRPPVPLDLYHEISQYFHDDVKNLSKLLGIDLEEKWFGEKRKL